MDIIDDEILLQTHVFDFYCRLNITHQKRDLQQKDPSEGSEF